MNDLAIIIPTKNATNLIACVSAIREHETEDRHEETLEPSSHMPILAVNDGVEPTSEQYNIMHGWYFDKPRKMFWCKGVNPFNFARNCNIGMRWAGDDYDIILLNDDALLATPGGFRAMQRAAYENPEYGVIGAVTNVTGQPLQHPENTGLREVPHFAFVCAFIPRRTIDMVGYLDERYCLDYGCEDRDYCEMCIRAGLKVGVYDGCYVDHASLTSTYRGDPHASRSYSQNQALFDQKWSNVRH